MFLLNEGYHIVGFGAMLLTLYFYLAVFFTINRLENRVVKLDVTETDESEFWPQLLRQIDRIVKN